MPNFNYLTLDEIIAIHFDQIERYGGSHGVRDLDLLFSAIGRVRATFGGFELYPDIFKKASALFHSLILNHPFVDGNKRTGVLSAGRFLYINGFELKATKDELVSFSLKITNKNLSTDKISSWLKKHSKKI